MDVRASVLGDLGYGRFYLPVLFPTFHRPNFGKTNDVEMMTRFLFFLSRNLDNNLHRVRHSN